MLPGTRALRTFEAAARHLNFTRAADEVGLTPAAVSYQIKEIEEQLGLVLFVRTSRSIQLTAAGAVLFEATVDALARCNARSAARAAWNAARAGCAYRSAPDSPATGCCRGWRGSMPRIQICN
ncbi:LysR family transcriptional regulator [Lysobacter capsici]|uniref:LysR family transcriptional regulator n=1 Tax=Lysobacter capsici TaxID=435897 RepID=UPI00398CBAF9